MTTENATRPEAAAADVPSITCRLCGSTELRSFLDLGATPPCELFLTAAAVEEPEPTYPLHVRVCERCLLAQIPPLITPEETFTEYAYFSSFSTSWVEHARRFVDGAVERLGLTPDSFVVEVASNDGYLLQHVVERGIRCLGVEPSVNVGEAARDKGVPTLTAFLTPQTGTQVREQHGPADLVCLNNVYAHIPDVVGFTEGLRAMVADDGWVSIEVQHLLTLVEHTQFDTVYHEHFQYYTVLSGQRALASGGLTPGRRRAAAHPRRLDPHVGPPVGGRGRAEPGRARRAGRRTAGGPAHRRGPRRVRRGRLPGARRPRRVPHPGAAGGQEGGGLRRPGQGQHAAQLLRHPARPARLHRRPQPLQARPLHPGHPHPDPGARADRRRTSPTTC